MKTNKHFTCRPLFLILPTLCAALPGGARGEIVTEAFDYQPERIEIREGASRVKESFFGGTGWDPDLRKAWTFGFWGNLEQFGGEVSYDVILAESLKAPDGLEEKYSSTGGRLANQEEKLVITASRGLDVEGGPLSFAVLPSTTGEENLGRRKAGIGAPGKEVWLSALMMPGSELFGAWLKLGNSGYGSTPISSGGLSFHIDPTKGKLNVQQDWPLLNRLKKDPPGRGSEIISISEDEPVLLVAKIQFGDEWGGETPFATKDANTFDPETTPTDGTVTVWINPDLSSEPKTSQAVLTVPIFEFRFDMLSIRLAPGASIDEIRLAPNFEELLKAN